MERATGTEVYGCGSPQSTDITLNIQTTTGGNFSISLDGKHTVEYLKKVVSKKLKVSKDRICLLHRERQLRDGTLEENGLLDGSRIILLPSVETGLLSQRPENSVMQALESLNDTQVNDFLSGKSPLNLTMRLGDNMMLIQLQLSTLNSSGSRSVRTSTPTKVSKSSMTCDAALDTPSPQTTSEKSPIFSDEDIPLDTDMPAKVEKPSCIIDKQDWELLQNAFDLYRSMTVDKYTDIIKTNDVSMDTSNCTVSDTSSTSLESTQSPIKSLSNLVSSPINTSTSEEKDKPVVKKVSSSLLDLLTKGTSLEPVPSTSGTTKKICSSSSATCQTTSAISQPTSAICQPTSANSDSSLSDDSDNFTDQSSFLAENTIDEYPMENLFNSAVDKGLFEDQEESMMDREISNLATTSNGAQDSANGNLPSFQSITEPLKNKRFQLLLHKTSKFKHPIGQNKQKAFMQSIVNKHKKRMQNRQDSNLAHPSTSRTEPYITNSRKLILQPSNEQESEDNMAIPSTSKQTIAATDTAKQTQALIEASKNLTQKLKKLSKEVLTNKLQLRAVEELRSKIGSGAGAVIESMKHHGKGIYSGTFSGTLNPALQDRYGRPKRDISTIIHILNDLLCAAPPIALAQKDSKHSCSPSTLDEPNKCLGCSQPSCSYGQCDGHLPSTSTADSKDCNCDQQNCQCGRLTPNTCPTCSGKSNTGELCKKCDSAKTLAMENSKTKCKLEQLRLVMQQKKQRREERKLKTLPYISPQKALTTSPEPTPIQEEIETVA